MAIKIDPKDHKELTIWHTPDFHIWTQGAFWYTVNNRLQFTPGKAFGLVCVTPAGVHAGCVPAIVGYLVFRPCALELDIPQEVQVNRCAVNQETMQEWYKAYKPWVHVKSATR